MELEEESTADQDAARQALAFIEEAIAEAERRVALEHRRLDLLQLAAQTILDAVESGRAPELTMPLFEATISNGKGPGTPSLPALSTVQAVRAILGAPANRGKFLSVKAMVHLMRQNGLLKDDLKYPQNTVLEAAKRLHKKDNRVERENRDGVALFRMRGEGERRVFTC